MPLRSFKPVVLRVWLSNQQHQQYLGTYYTCKLLSLYCTGTQEVGPVTCVVTSLPDDPHIKAQTTNIHQLFLVVLHL